MGTNKTDCYSAAWARLLMRARLFPSIRDPLSRRRYKRLGQEADSYPSSSRKPGNRRHAGQRLPRSGKIRDILTRHPLWDAYDSRCISCGRCTTGCPTCTRYMSLTSPMMKIRSAANAVASGSCGVVPGLRQRPAVMVFAKTGERSRYRRALHKVNDYSAQRH